MAESSDRRSDAILGAILAVGAALRFSTWTQVFDTGRVFIDEPDGFYHLRRAWLILQQWPRVPQFDPWLNAPAGGRISWPPLFDWLVATLTLPWRTDPARALEVIGALLPPILGVLQIAVIYALAASLATRRAGYIAALAAAVLPASVRYTLVGALDHDPLYELAVLTALWAAAREMRRASRANVALMAGALVVAFLSWAGAIVLAAILGLVLVALAAVSRDRFASAARVVALGAVFASIVILPFIARSTWTRTERATFEGLSLLHLAVLLGLAGASGIASSLIDYRGDRLLRATSLVAAAIAVALTPITIGPLLAGARYAAGDAAILRTVAEAQPLLMLFGRFDPAPMLIRLTVLPIFAIVALPIAMFRRKNASAAVGTGWLCVTLTLALLHSRFSFSAALATALAAGLLFDLLVDRYGAARVTLLAAAIALPGIAAYVPVPGWEAFNFYRRGNSFRELEADAICGRLRARPAGVAFAPWWFGHWALWSAQKPVVQSPMLSVGQTQFGAASRFYFVTDDREAIAMLDRWRVRYLIVTQKREDLEALAPSAGTSAAQFMVREAGGAQRVNLPRYLDTVAARLALWGPRELRAFGRVYPPIPRLKEIDRTAAHVNGPFGPVPFIAVYEVVP